MVQCSRVLLRKYGNFIDNLRVMVKGGAGGMGLPRLGGEGGKGGDVLMVAKHGVTMKNVKEKYAHKRFVGDVGANSSVRSLKGSSGPDCSVNVPVGITITTDDGRKIGELDKEGDQLRVARGGQGGGFRTNFHPSKGQKRVIRLDMKLIADVGLVGDLRPETGLMSIYSNQRSLLSDSSSFLRRGVLAAYCVIILSTSLEQRCTHFLSTVMYLKRKGFYRFPNAGKSSLLSKVSHAKPQIADYPFTTVKPELGKIMYSDFKQISVADLPGLIEGAHINRGMGHKFLKHVERTKQLLFVVDVGGFQLSFKTPFRTAFETVQLLILELELYKEELLDKPALLAVNKMDVPGAEEKFQELMKQLENPQDYLHILPEELVPDRQIAFRHILPVSVVSGRGIEELTRCIRRSLDEQAELEIQEAAQKKLRSLHKITFPSVTDKIQTSSS